MAGPLHEAMNGAAGLSNPIPMVRDSEVTRERANREAEALAARAMQAVETEKRLRLQIIELALRAQQQNGGEHLSTEELIKRANALYDFVNTKGSTVPAASR